MSEKPVVYLGLVHHPIKNKRDQVVTTSVTNLDVHDISRSCRTFGIKKYFIVTPLDAQHTLIKRILGHWEAPKSSAYNPDRQSALELAELSKSVEDSIENVTQAEGCRPIVAVTGANFSRNDGDERALVGMARGETSVDKRPILLLFGTGWGLSDQVTDQADFMLGPIWSTAEDGYNHLSVRSAVAIYLDRLSTAMKS